MMKLTTMMVCLMALTGLNSFAQDNTANSGNGPGNNTGGNEYKSALIQNTSYDNKDIYLECVDETCEQIRMIKSIDYDGVEYVDTYLIERATIEATAKDRRKFSSYKLENTFEHTNTITSDVAQSYKEGSYIRSGLVSIGTPFATAMDVISLPFNAAGELVRKKRKDSPAEKRAAKKILKSLDLETAGTLSYKEARYKKIRSYLSKVAKTESLSEGLDDFISKFNSRNRAKNWRDRDPCKITDSIYGGYYTIAINGYVNLLGDYFSKKHDRTLLIAHVAELIEEGTCK